MFLFLTDERKEALSFAFGEFFKENSLILIYLLIINIATFIVFAVDKFKAIRRSYRIPIVTLLILAFLGGAAGGLSAMYLFRHKTQKDYFVIGLPLMLVMQIILIVYIMNL